MSWDELQLVPSATSKLKFALQALFSEECGRPLGRQREMKKCPFYLRNVANKVYFQGRRLMILMQRSPERRVGTILLAAIVLLFVALLIRLVLDAAHPIPASVPPASGPVALSSPERVAHLQTRLGRNPENANLYAQLGLAYLQRARGERRSGLLRPGGTVTGGGS